MRLRGLTYGNVVATLALFVALGGTSYAVMKLPPNSVGSAQVRDGSLAAADLARDARSAPRGPRGAQGPAGAPGAPGAPGTPGARGPANVIAASKDDAVYAGTGAGAAVDVLVLPSVPPGDYWAMASTNVVYAGVNLFFRCDLFVDDQPQGINAAVMSGVNPGGAVASMIVRQEALHLAATAAVKLRCNHESALSGDTNGRFERSRLTLIQTGSISLNQQ